MIIYAMDFVNSLEVFFMTPEVHAHFELDLSNTCNWCSGCCRPRRLYISKSNKVEEWNPSKGSIEAAVESYVRMRQIARRRFSESGLDSDAGLAVLDKEVDLLAIANSGEPPTVEELRKTAVAVDKFIRGGAAIVAEGFWPKWLTGLFS